MDIIDFIFWKYYCFFKKHRRLFYMNILDTIELSTSLMILTVYILLCTISYLCSVPLFVCYIYIPLMFLARHLLDKRYRSKNLSKDGYKIFRDRYDNIHCKTLAHIIVVLYTILTIFGIFIIGFLFQHIG